MEHFKRKTPEEILLSIYKLGRGRLKVLVGAVSGSGKTYQMLREGQHLRQQGIDVVICGVSTLGRPETVEQVGSLERVPSIHWFKDGVERKDLNLEALIERNPEVVLVDNLAHRNREGARFATRLDDIHYLLNKGIGVITTINVYELEGMHEIAQKLTGIEAEETVPADTLELADEVWLIDVSPETVLKRFAEGGVQGGRNGEWLERGNLGVLRELSLRLMAEDVNESLEKHREKLGLIGPSGAAERILVSVQYHWNGSIYIRRGQQIAKRLNGELVACSFVRQGKELTREQATFRRSMIKLTEKIGASFEELPLPPRRALPAALVRFAMERHVTRIVLGHSKQNRWQELIQGSIVSGILKHTRNIDIFMVADRTEREGERIIPTKRAPEQANAPFRRLSDDEVEEKIGRIRRGKFKVYIGAAPGVGKTYTMLREGNDLRKKGIDVVVGLLETHGRQETAAQVGDLMVVPRKIVHYKEAKLEEMDTDEIIRRNPEVVLVDELAHTNVPGSADKKRYEDVIRILEAGISVISTVNVQHLESLNDAVEQITGVRVRETVPDSILRLADEVELIDVTPESLRQRMKDGKIYAMGKVEQALGAFFKTGNLIALRELALREIADDVDERLESWERRKTLRGPWRRQEVICVCIHTGERAERLIRRGFRIAHRLKAAWFVMYVHEKGKPTDEGTAKRIETLRALTERFGGTFELHETRHRKQIAQVLVGKANEYRATQLIIGQSRRPFWHEWLYGSIVRNVLRSARHIDVLVVADPQPDRRS